MFVLPSSLEGDFARRRLAMSAADGGAFEGLFPLVVSAAAGFLFFTPDAMMLGGDVGEAISKKKLCDVGRRRKIA